MQTRLAPTFQARPEAHEAQAILRQCVHCGFCTATCPTYQLLGDELDGPRGRIYLMKLVLEGQTPTRQTQLHLDRCLTCRNCETTCPSGVRYGQLIDIGRKLVDEVVQRPARQRLLRWALKQGLTSRLFAPALGLGRLLRPMLPPALQSKVVPAAPAGSWPARVHSRRVLMLTGCVQPAMAPNINSATARVLDAAGLSVIIANAAGCCGALKFHLDDQTGALAQMRRNIDAWWPHVDPQGAGSDAVEAILINASGCSLAVKEYGHLLRDDAHYAEKARRISAMARDLSEYLAAFVDALKGKLHPASQTLVFHPPCTLQHGQQLRGAVEQHLQALGFTVRLARQDSHLCCGSAGTYSVLQPTLAGQLRDRKLAALSAGPQEIIISANIGCITHLQSASAVPVRHWVEVLDSALTAASRPADAP
jgi:glycolate oxidase iron-sulfur subunit